MHDKERRNKGVTQKAEGVKKASVRVMTSVIKMQRNKRA